MKKLLVFLVIIITLLSAPYAYCGNFFTLTVDNTVRDLTSVCSGNSHVFMVLETAQIRFKIDGSSPSTTAGLPLEAGQNLNLVGSDKVGNFKAIRTGAVSGVLQGYCE